MSNLKKTVLTLMVLFGCVGCDQVTKVVARQQLAGVAPIRLFHDSLRLQYAENPGAFLSFGANLPEDLRNLIFLVLTGALLFGLLLYLAKSQRTNTPVSLALALLLGGGCGNLIDRIFNHGRVIDFINLGIGPLRTGIFNVADIAITFGALWLLMLSGGLRRRRAKN